MFDIGKGIIFFYKALLLGSAFVLGIPKGQYRKFIIYGIFFGGMMELAIVVIGSYFHLLKYSHTEPFSLFGILSFWTPISWMFALSVFLYFLPVRKIFFYMYIFIWAIFGTFVGLVLEGLEVYSFNKLVMFIVFLVWFSLSAIVYTQLERIPLKAGMKRS